RKGAREHGILADRHGANGIAMIRIVKSDEFTALWLARIPPVLKRQLERDFNGGRSVIRVEHPSQPGWQKLHETFSEVDCRSMRTPGEDDVFELSRLVGERLVEARMGVSMDVDPPR